MGRRHYDLDSRRTNYCWRSLLLGEAVTMSTPSGCGKWSTCLSTGYATVQAVPESSQQSERHSSSPAS